MLDVVSSNVFANSNSIKLTPVVFAEWNQNIFNPPYATVAGDGTLQTGISTTTTLTDVSGSSAKTGFTTKKFAMAADKDTIEYSITPTATSSAFKIITYIKTNQNNPIMASVFAQGSSSQFGSSSVEINSFGWLKVETYIGGASKTDNISSFTYKIILNRFSTADPIPEVLFTVPQVYATTYFDYQYNSMWPSDSVFTNFRPGESYVNTGSSKFSFPSNFRKVNENLVNGYTGDAYMPVSPIVQNPQSINVAPPVPLYKNGLLSDMNQYKYFISDNTSKSITGIYDPSGIIANKIVIKFNTLMAVPTINVAVNGSNITVDGSQAISLATNSGKESNGVREDAGVLVLYWTGSAWTRSRWSVMPTFSSTGSIATSTTINKITVTQTTNTARTQFASYTSAAFIEDLARMQVIEISPRLELDLTNYLLSISINKSIDSKNTFLPISSVNSDDCSITLSGLPAGNISSFVPIFSSQSNKTQTVLKGMLRKNIKFYTGFYLENYFDDTTKAFISPNTFIPGGIFYSDTWEESDINEVTIQTYDIGRYLQSTPVSDYVSNLKTVVDVISNILDLSGFTDYDYDSLYTVCNNKNVPIDLAYFYVNSKDTTLVDALDQIFLPYQIGAFINEYGIMKFLSLSEILGTTSTVLTVDDSDILENGYSVVNNAKPGKVSLRYQSPKIKQSLALQNLLLEANSPSFIYTTGSDIVWAQQNADSVGMNYLNENMDSSQNYFVMDNNDLLDIFHTYNLNTTGYAAIENEIVSFVYKEYTIEDQSNNIVYASVKNDIELAAEIDRFNKKYMVGLKTTDGSVKTGYNKIIEPTGKITNVQRGMFGTKISDHTVLDSSNAASKNISCKQMSNTYVVTGLGTYSSSTDNEFKATTATGGKTLFYPTTERSSVSINSTTEPYKTYSCKFNLADIDLASGGLFFNLANTEVDATNAYFLELVKYNTFTITEQGEVPFDPPRYMYALVFYQFNGTENVIAYADVTSTIKNIIANTEKVLEKSGTGEDAIYTPTTDPRYDYFHLKATTYKSSGTINYTNDQGQPATTDDGESTTVVNLLSVFLNNVEIRGWKVYDDPAWVPIAINEKTGLPKKVQLNSNITAGTIFGSFISTDPVEVSELYYPEQNGAVAGAVREIYATHKSLKERSVNYYFQDREFLNGMIQNQNIFSKSKSYMMQTKPSVLGINTYDVQYTTPAAVSVDVLPVEYLLQYFPGSEPVDKKYLQKKEVDEYSLSYSTILNTGFRAKFAIANNTSHMVFLKKDSTEIMPLTVVLNLWTQELIAPSDPEVIEKVMDKNNMAETIQLDSNWIQSKESANKLINVIARGIDNFSKEVRLQIFGNPLIQVGDIVQVSYSLSGLNQQKYMVNSVSHSFDTGLSTSLSLNMIDSGISY